MGFVRGFVDLQQVIQQPSRPSLARQGRKEGKVFCFVVLLLLLVLLLVLAAGLRGGRGSPQDSVLP